MKGYIIIIFYHVSLSSSAPIRVWACVLSTRARASVVCTSPLIRGHDGLDRLSSGEGETETYDELSNLVTRGANTYQYQDPDEPDSDQMRLASYDNGTVYSYTYDSNGNPTAITNRFSSLSYDSLNALRQIVHAQTDNYWYNQDGLRVKRTENAAGTWKTTYTLYEGDNILMREQYDNSGRLQVVFNIIVNGQILAQYKRVYPSTDSVAFFYVDYLGSRRVVMNSAGTVLDRYRYSAWGAATQDVGTDDYRSFTGKDYDATGLIYFNARYYDPMTGRFLTEDPARKGGNWYAYCGNNPVNRIDQTGREYGDQFNSPDEAAYDFAVNYNDNSIREGREYAAFLFTFTVTDAKGRSKTVWTYTKPIVGTAPGEIPVKVIKAELDRIEKNFTMFKFLKNPNVIAFAHTHGRYTEKATTGTRQSHENYPAYETDQTFAIGLIKMPTYTIGPAGTLHLFNPWDEPTIMPEGFIRDFPNKIPKDYRDVWNPENINTIIY